MQVRSGTQLGPYIIGTRIGAGGMGEVYRALDQRLNRAVAIKVLREELSADARARSRFRSEAKAIAALSHPNIVCIYDVQMEENPPFLVTELLDGETLRHRLRRGRLDWRSVLEIGAAIADGLNAAHTASIIHRDLKPENVFITTSGAIKLLTA
jgi:serine/threonine protein kinase